MNRRWDQMVEAAPYAASGIDMAVLGLGVGLGLVALLGVAALCILWWLI